MINLLLIYLIINLTNFKNTLSKVKIANKFQYLKTLFLLVKHKTLMPVKLDKWLLN
jgi:hypothetical protein